MLMFCCLGYFCVGGVVDPQSTTIWKNGMYQVANYSSFLCPLGHRCAEGSSAPIPCDAGTYQDRQGQGNCSICPKGFYCEQGAIEPSPCIQGSYCLEGTKSSHQYLCQNGTYG